VTTVANDNDVDINGLFIGVTVLMAVLAEALLKRGLMSRQELDDGIEFVKTKINPQSAGGADFCFKLFASALDTATHRNGEVPSWRNAERPAPPAWFKGVIE
jgi:hypothetical protein